MGVDTMTGVWGCAMLGDGDGFEKLTALPLASVILMAFDFFTGRTKLLEADAGPACAWLTGVCEGAAGLCAGVPG